MHEQRTAFRPPVLLDSSQAHVVRDMCLRLCAVALTFLSVSSHADERPLRFSVTESGVMPMIDIRNGKAVGGILYDLPVRLAEKVGRRAEFIVMPRLRVQRALMHKEVDVRCYVNPAWLSEAYTQYVWSVPFMLQRDLLVSRNAEPIQPDALAKQSIGTVLGFTYPTLDSLFVTGRLRRDDGRTQGLVLHKLSAGRYDYAVSNELALHWYNRQHEENEKLHEVHELSNDVVACLIRDEPDVPTQQLLRAMVQMKEDGEFDTILKRYR